MVISYRFSWERSSHETIDWETMGLDPTYCPIGVACSVPTNDVMVLHIMVKCVRSDINPEDQASYRVVPYEVTTQIDLGE